jgi:fibronectin type 3 domain-containing protein
VRNKERGKKKQERSRKEKGKRDEYEESYPYIHAIYTTAKRIEQESERVFWIVTKVLFNESRPKGEDRTRTKTEFKEERKTRAEERNSNRVTKRRILHFKNK